MRICKELNWDDLKIFLVAAKAESLAVAAKHLGINQTTLSRRIGALEVQLNNALFDRSKRQWRLTSFGESIYQEADPMRQLSARIERLAVVHNTALQGRLRITAPEACFHALLIPLISQFEKKHPLIQIELISSTKALDLVSSQADVAFRVTENPASDLVGCHIARFGVAVYARADLLRAFTQGEPVTCIDWLDQAPAKWIQRNVGDKARIVATNSLVTMAELVRSGVGIAQLYCVLGDADPKLLRLPDTHSLSSASLWLLTHTEVRNNARVNAFRTFAIESLRDKVGIIEGQAVEEVGE